MMWHANFRTVNIISGISLLHWYDNDNNDDNDDEDDDDDKEDDYRLISVFSAETFVVVAVIMLSIRH